MQDQQQDLPWEQKDWLQQAIEWIHTQLTASGLQIVGSVELIHQRPWSSFASVPTADGTVYFKAAAPAFKYEIALTQALAQWRPDCTVRVIAVDLDRGWLLSANAGDTLSTVSQSSAQIEHWLKMLPLTVEFQIEMAGRVAELLELGVPDRRLATLPEQYSQLLQANGSLRVDMEPGLTREEYQQLRDLRPRFAAWCEELADYGLKETLTHEELHDSNVLVSGNRYIFTDWSDCSVSHPFFAMVVMTRAAAHRLHLAEDGKEMVRLRDAYLEPWTKFTTRSKLLTAFDLAYRLGMVNRALSWHHGTGSLSKRHKEPYADAVPGWLQDFLNAETPISPNAS